MRKPSIYFKDDFLNRIVPLYIESIRNPRTANEYFSYTCLLCDYLEKDFLEINEADAQKYYDYLYSKYYSEELNRKTINVRFASYKRLAGFICEHHLSPGYSNPFSRIKRIPINDDVSAIHVISMTDLDKVMSEAKPDPMMYLILALAGRCAFRLSEITGLKESMIQISDEKVYVTFPRKSDYDYPDVRLLPDDVSKLMIDYLKNIIYFSDSKYLFYNESNRPITSRNVDSAVERYVKRAGLSHKYTIKDIRTRCIIDMKNAGLPNELIADYTKLQVHRIKSYDNAARAAKTCPADLVNYQLKID